MLLSIAVFCLVLGGLLGLILGGYRAYDYSFQQTQATAEAEQGIETMVKEIKEAITGDDGSYIIERANDYEFVFFSDIDKDGAIERLKYFIDGSNFKKEVIDPTGSPPFYITDKTNPDYSGKTLILSKYVRNQPPIFHYFDNNLQELPPPARLKDTKLMRVYLVINVDPSLPPQDFVLESDIQLRNLKTNL